MNLLLQQVDGKDASNEWMQQVLGEEGSLVLYLDAMQIHQHTRIDDRVDQCSRFVDNRGGPAFAQGLVCQAADGDRPRSRD